MVDKLPKGTKGGQKQLYLKQHRAEIIAFYRSFGSEEACRQYNMTEQTLKKLLNSPEPLNRKDDRAVIIAQMAEARSVEIKKEVDDLKRQYSIFVDSVARQLLEKFFRPLLQQTIKLPAGLEWKPDTMLKLDDLDELIDNIDDNFEAK